MKIVEKSAPTIDPGMPLLELLNENTPPGSCFFFLLISI